MAGEIHVNKIANSLTAKQFQEWELYNAMEPFGEKRADWRAASIVQMIFNMAVGAKDRKKIHEFLLQFEPKTAASSKSAGQSWQEKKAIGMAIAAAYGAAGKKQGPMDSRAQAALMADAVLKTYLPKEK